jgi:hypothetical protein
MQPLIWLYRLETVTIRVVQRDRDGGGTEIVLLGPEGLRRRQRCATPEKAQHFRRTLEAELRAGGFVLRWTNAPSPDP